MGGASQIIVSLIMSWPVPQRPWRGMKATFFKKNNNHYFIPFELYIH